MGIFVLKDASVVINSVDLSDHVLSVSLNLGAEIQDPTAMGDTTRLGLAGLIEWSIDVTFKQDFAASNVDATLFPLVGAAAFAVVIKPTSGSVSSTNPSYTGNAVLATYNVLGQSVGDVAESTISLMAAGVLARAES